MGAKGDRIKNADCDIAEQHLREVALRFFAADAAARARRNSTAYERRKRVLDQKKLHRMGKMRADWDISWNALLVSFAATFEIKLADAGELPPKVEMHLQDWIREIPDTVFERFDSEPFVKSLKSSKRLLSRKRPEALAELISRAKSKLLKEGIHGIRLSPGVGRELILVPEQDRIVSKAIDGVAEAKALLGMLIWTADTDLKKVKRGRARKQKLDAEGHFAKGSHLVLPSVEKSLQLFNALSDM